MILILILILLLSIKSKKDNTLCLTCNDTIIAYKTKVYAEVQPCIKTVRIQKEWDSIYNPYQLFHLYPLLKAPQKVYGYQGSDKKCLTYGKTLGIVSLNPIITD